MNPLNDPIAQTPDLRILCHGVNANALGIAPARRINHTPLRELAPQRVLILTNKTLRLPNRARIWGYAWHRRNVAIVSTQDLDLAVTSRRLANVVSHEFGHLDGYGHCTSEGCLMQPLASPKALDHRSFERCGHCPRPVPLRDCIWAAAGCVFFMALIHLITG